MMTTLMTRLALAALFALPLAGMGTTLPAFANDPVDFVCFDVVQPDGSTEVECEPAGLVATQCEKSDPGAVSNECKAVKEFGRPQREWVVPASLTEGGDNDGGGTPGGGVVGKPRPNMLKN